VRLPNHRLWLILVLCAFLAPVARSQQNSQPARPATPAASQDSTYHLSAGRSSLKEIGGERVLELTEGVNIRHGNVTITSREGRQIVAKRVTFLIGNVNIDQNALHMEGDEGEYHRFEDLAILKGNVKIVDRGWTILADRADFYRAKNQAWLVGNVVAADTATEISADTVFYDQNTQIVEAFGNMTVSNPSERIVALGKHGIFYKNRSEALMDDEPRMIVDPESDQPANVESDFMRFYPSQNRAVASGRVKIIKGAMVTQCDSAVVIDSEKRAELYGSPLAQQDNVSMKGDRMILFYNEDEVDRIRLVGDATIRETPKDSLVVGRDSWVLGDSMQLYLHDNHLDSLEVGGKASSEYYPRSADRVEANFAQGDRMFFVFRNDSLWSVKVEGKQAEGLYRYVNLKRGQTSDSLRAEIDTALVYVPFERDAERIAYSADSIQYLARERDLLLGGTAKVDYRGRTLLAKSIKYNSDLQILDATGAPVLVEGGEKLHGTQMGYDLDTGVGLVREGSTKFIQGYYQGEEIAKVGDNVLKVWNSRYTTCDLRIPHYHFTSDEMKVYLDDKVVTGPITLYVGETPVLALPFFAQNIRQGRRSGILRPDIQFGITGGGERFIRNIGYYWATNDYMDFTVVGDFNENSRTQFRLDNRYALRYRFDGGVNYRWVRSLDNKTNEWTVHALHNMEFLDGYRFNADLSFVSSDAAPNEVNNIDQVADIINRNIRSTARLGKNWQGIIGFSASADRQQYLNVTRRGAVKLNMTLPDVQLSIPSRTLYFGQRTMRGDKGFWEEVLDGVRFSPGLNFRRTYNERILGETGVVVNSTTTPLRKTDVISSNQSISFSSPLKVGFINISPSFAASNQYLRTATEVDAHLDTLVVPGDTTIVAAGSLTVTDNTTSWNVGASASTNFYGTMSSSLGALTGIRHRLAPSISYSYRPPLGDRPRSQIFGVGISNSFDIKVKNEKGEERKISNLLIWSLRSSYNPDATSKRGWSTINSSVNSQVYGVNLSLTNNIDPYSWEVGSTQLTSNFTFRGTHGLGLAKSDDELDRNPLADDTTEVQTETPMESDTDETAPLKEGLPWTIRAAYSLSKVKGFESQSTLNFGGTINVTQNWLITYNASYDMETRQVQGQNFSIYRDLHCWEMSISRQQLGDRWEYYFRITLKAHPELYASQGPRGLAGGAGIPGQFSY
jgi:lipopolysaccharide assembly outer membrane protein LptD (OstA)